MRKTALFIGVLCLLLILIGWAIGMCGVYRYAESRPAPTRTPTMLPSPTYTPFIATPTIAPVPPTPYPPPRDGTRWYPVLPRVDKGE